MSEDEPAARVRVGAITFAAADAAALARFYAEAFGLGDVKRAAPDHVGVRAANTYLGFDQVDDVRAGQSRSVVWFDVADATEAFARLCALGAVPVMEPDGRCSPGETLATVADPEGNLVGLIGPGSSAD